MSTHIDVSQFLNYAASEDWGPAIGAAVASLLELPGEKLLTFPKGTYHVHADQCSEEYLFISNHDHSLKRIAFSLKDVEDLTIDGNGSAFIFHGRLLPFQLESCKRVTLRNFSMDYARPFFTQGEVLDADEEQVTLRIDPELYPFYVEEEQIHFVSPGEWDSTYIKWFMEFDPIRRAPAYGLGDSNLRDQKVRAEQLASNEVKFRARFKQKHTVGHIINITHEKRYHPGIFINECEDIRLENITIYHAGAMGIIGQFSRNVHCRQVTVSSRPDGERLVSTNNDATHFVHCEGEIVLEDCTFQHQLDDATNVHGVYTTISRIHSQTCLEVQNMHVQQEGNRAYRAGDRISFIDPETRLNKGWAVVKKVEWLNGVYGRLQIEPEAGTAFSPGDAIENGDRMPHVIVRNCRIGDNRARGLLISTKQGALIENNEFYTSGSSIACGGELEFWYESGSVRDVIIRGNRFINCGYAKGGDGLIKVSPKRNRSVQTQDIHDRIRVTDNEFYTFKPNVLKLVSVQGVDFVGNRIRFSTEFETFGPGTHTLELQACSDVRIENNRVEGFEESRFLLTDEFTEPIQIANNEVKQA